MCGFGSLGARWTAPVLLGLIVLLMAPRPGAAYQLRVDDLSCTGAACVINDDFNDGVIGASWLPQGTVSESGGFVTFEDPGIGGNLVFPDLVLDDENSVLFQAASMSLTAGAFSVESRWEAGAPGFSEGVNQTFRAFGTGFNYDLSVTVRNRTPEVAALTGRVPGLVLSSSLQIRDLSDLILGTTHQDIALAPGQFTGDIILRSNWSDVANEMSMAASLDGGSSFLELDPIFFTLANSAHIVLSAGTVVPEPATASLLVLGLLGVGAAGRRRR